MKIHCKDLITIHVKYNYVLAPSKCLWKIYFGIFVSYQYFFRRSKKAHLSRFPEIESKEGRWELFSAPSLLHDTHHYSSNSPSPPLPAQKRAEIFNNVSREVYIKLFITSNGFIICVNAS